MIARVLLVLAILAAGDAAAATKKTTKPATPSSKVLARVGNSVVTQADYEARLAELPPQYKNQFTTPEQKRQFVDRLLEERIWLETALKAGVDKRPEIRKQLENYRRDTLIRRLFAQVFATVPAP